MNADFFGMNPLDGKEVWHIAKSVAKWTWRNLSEQGFSAWQSQAGKKGAVQSALVRSAATEEKRASARLMNASGVPIGVIAMELHIEIARLAQWLD